ncbi:enhanced serine sensitivity protein SseB C-terminal domain-containing protein [Scandinavium sp. NPDC088450]|uniref:enhanced serine sensitivity protein SseB C-terminal domain-containing protein n=1 Tax=Scandinavium sp. NPDC088450 TaxID=3364514 RepID=UPI00384E9284
MASSLYVLGTSAGEAVDGHVDLKAGEHISIQHWEKPDGTTAIPVFSSLATLQHAIEAESQYLKLPARDFFEMTKGQGVFLNPRSDYGKEFVPEEIETPLAEGTSRLPQSRVVKEETRVYLGEPAVVPERMLTELSAWFAKCPGVRCAYLVLMHDPSVDDRPHYLVAVDVTGGVERVIRGAGLVAGDTSLDGQAVDLLRLGQNNGGLESHITTQFKPFYVRSMKQRLLAMFSR